MEDLPVAKVGYQTTKEKEDFLDKAYYAFNFEVDTMKQWLQISSEGEYSFGQTEPYFRFIQYINKQLTSTENKVAIFARFSSTNKPTIQFSDIIQDIKNNREQIDNLNYTNSYHFYKICKKFHASSIRRILTGRLKNSQTGTTLLWNLFNFSDRDKGEDFFISPRTNQRIISTVASHSTDECHYSLELSIVSTPKPDIEALQDIIMKSNNKKKLSIVMSDKLEEMVDYYIKDSDVDASFKRAVFFNDLYNEGIDLSVREINNSAYVFIAKQKFDDAMNLLREGKRKIVTNDLDDDDQDLVCLIYYNYGIVCVHLGRYDEAVENFNSIINFCKNKSDDFIPAAGVLNLLQLNADGNIEVVERKPENENSPSISIKEFTELNLKLLENRESK